MSSIDSEEMDAADGGDVIYLEKGALPKDLVADLAGRFPERTPQMVPPMPDWLGALLGGWDLRRHEVIRLLQVFWAVTGRLPLSTLSFK